MEDKVKQKIKKIVKYLIEKTKPTKIILFGSRAKKNNRKSSDIDLAVDTKTEVDFRTKRKIKEEVKKISGLYDVDIVYLSEVDKDFKNLIVSTGIVLYEKRRGSVSTKKI